jgi:hypothetical protein
MLRNKKIGGTGKQTKTLNAGSILQFDMSRGAGLKTLSYMIRVNVNHDNSAAISTLNAYAMMRDAIDKIEFVTGAGKSLFNITAQDLNILNLRDNGAIRASIDGTSGTGKKSFVLMRLDFKLPDDFMNPMDTVLDTGDTQKYNYMQVKVTPKSTFGDITSYTVNSINIDVSQNFKINPKPSVIDSPKGRVQVVPQSKFIRVKEFSYTANISDQEIEIPNGTNVVGVIAYVADSNGDFKSGASINNLALKNGGDFLYNATGQEANEDLRELLKDYSDTNADNVHLMDFAKGSLAEGFFTTRIENQSATLNFDLTAGTGTNILRVMFITVENA